MPSPVHQLMLLFPFLAAAFLASGLLPCASALALHVDPRPAYSQKEVAAQFLLDHWVDQLIAATRRPLAPSSSGFPQLPALEVFLPELRKKTELISTVLTPISSFRRVYFDGATGERYAPNHALRKYGGSGIHVVRSDGNALAEQEFSLKALRQVLEKVAEQEQGWVDGAGETTHDSATTQVEQEQLSPVAKFVQELFLATALEEDAGVALKNSVRQLAFEIAGEMHRLVDFDGYLVGFVEDPAKFTGGEEDREFRPSDVAECRALKRVLTEVLEDGESAVLFTDSKQVWEWMRDGGQLLGLGQHQQEQHVFSEVGASSSSTPRTPSSVSAMMPDMPAACKHVLRVVLPNRDKKFSTLVLRRAHAHDDITGMVMADVTAKITRDFEVRVLNPPLERGENPVSALLKKGLSSLSNAVLSGGLFERFFGRHGDVDPVGQRRSQEKRAGGGAAAAGDDAATSDMFLFALDKHPIFEEIVSAFPQHWAERRAALLSSGGNNYLSVHQECVSSGGKFRVMVDRTAEALKATVSTKKNFAWIGNRFLWQLWIERLSSSVASTGDSLGGAVVVKIPRSVKERAWVRALLRRNEQKPFANEKPEQVCRQESKALLARRQAAEAEEFAPFSPGSELPIPEKEEQTPLAIIPRRGPEGKSAKRNRKRREAQARAARPAGVLDDADAERVVPDESVVPDEFVGESLPAQEPFRGAEKEDHFVGDEELLSSEVVGDALLPQEDDSTLADHAHDSPAELLHHSSEDELYKRFTSAGSWEDSQLAKDGEAVAFRAVSRWVADMLGQFGEMMSDFTVKLADAEAAREKKKCRRKKKGVVSAGGEDDLDPSQEGGPAGAGLGGGTISTPVVFPLRICDYDLNRPLSRHEKLIYKKYRQSLEIVSLVRQLMAVVSAVSEIINDHAPPQQAAQVRAMFANINFFGEHMQQLDELEKRTRTSGDWVEFIDAFQEVGWAKTRSAGMRKAVETAFRPAFSGDKAAGMKALFDAVWRNCRNDPLWRKIEQLRKNEEEVSGTDIAGLGKGRDVVVSLVKTKKDIKNCHDGAGVAKKEFLVNFKAQYCKLDGKSFVLEKRAPFFKGEDGDLSLTCRVLQAVRTTKVVEEIPAILLRPKDLRDYVVDTTEKLADGLLLQRPKIEEALEKIKLLRGVVPGFGGIQRLQGGRGGGGSPSTASAAAPRPQKHVVPSFFAAKIEQLERDAEEEREKNRAIEDQADRAIAAMLEDRKLYSKEEEDPVPRAGPLFDLQQCD